MIALLLMADGRQPYLDRTVASAAKHLHGNITERWVYTESAAAAVAAGGFTRIGVDGPPKGFHGSIADAWSILSTRSAARYVFHLEQDFEFNRDVDLDELAEVMDDNPYLVQMALLRQPWSRKEMDAGGIVQMDPGAYTQMMTLPRLSGSDVWLEHRKWFTTNPSLYRRELMDRGWPVSGATCSSWPGSEAQFSASVFEDLAARCAYWGMGEPWVEHIGHVRAGNGY